MLKLYKLITTILISFIACSGLNAQKDSLTHAYLSIANSYLYNNSDSSYKYLELSTNLSKSTESHSLLAESYKTLGIWHYLKSNNDSSHSYLDSAYSLYAMLNDDLGRAEVLKNRAFLIQKSGDIEATVDLFLQCLKTYQSLNKPYEVGQINANLGNSYFRLEAYETAKEKYLQSLRVFNDSDEATESDIGGTFIALGNTYKALLNYDSSEYYYQAAIRTFDGKQQLAMAFIFNNLAGLYQLQNKLDSAEHYFIKSIEIKKKLGHERGYISSVKNLSEILRAKQDYSKALSYIKDAYDKALVIKDSFLIRDIHIELAEVYHNLGEYEKSNNYFRGFIQLNSKLSGLEKTQIISEMEEKYENEKNTKRITELELQNQQAKNERNLYIFGALTLVLVVFFLSVQIHQRKKNSRLLKYKNDQISIALSEKETLLKEIHHRVKNNLQVVSSLLNLQAGDLTDEAADAIKEGQLRVKSMALIHQKLYQENDLKGIEVQGYLENLVTELFTSYGTNTDQIHYEVDAKKLKLDVDTLVPLGLIMNELITNSLKYAFQKSSKGLLSIYMKEENDKLKVTISDNGVGMDTTNSNSTSFGWKMIKSLCRQLKADMDIVTSAGTKVTLTVSRYKLIP